MLRASVLTTNIRLWGLGHCDRGWSERDVEGYEMRMPDGMTIPQLKGDESYKYLGTELRTGWANGEGQTEMRKRCVADCKRVIWII